MKQKIIAITGSAKGIGKSIAEKFIEKGAYVALLDFDKKAGEATEKAMKEDGGDAFFIQTDVSDYHSLKEARKKILEKWGEIDVLIVNAGISYLHSLNDISVEEWDRVIKINLTGSFYTVKAFYEDFSKKTPIDEGKIIFISSGSAITGTGGGAHYAASKAGQHGLMRNLAKEFGGNGVNVNAIAPRVIQTDLLDQLYPTPKSREKLIKKIPIGRIGKPEDIANLTVFLASPESSYIHGQIILSDGGRTY
ncbi:MAG: SDR family oxidoreductase [Carnobacterium inhibens]|uniref:SDR family NAD(P)-dependent oxidoreductase n=1 Tax=Carnobacterium inhibens TaxID=147709 RepID=UPI0033151E40